MYLVVNKQKIPSELLDMKKWTILVITWLRESEIVQMSRLR